MNIRPEPVIKTEPFRTLQIHSQESPASPDQHALVKRECDSLSSASQPSVSLQPTAEHESTVAILHPAHSLCDNHRRKVSERTEKIFDLMMK